MPGLWVVPHNPATPMPLLVECSRCRAARPALPRPPFRPGTPLEALGATVQARVCADCYRDWMAMSVKLVNETRLDVTSDDGRARWLAQMKLFLALDAAGDPWARWLNTRVRVEALGGAAATATLVGLDDDTLRLADFVGGSIPAGFTPLDTHGSACIARDAVIVLESAP